MPPNSSCCCDTVSCCLRGNVTVLAGFRVRRLGYYDHTQRQLGERALYVFPAKGDATRITCEGPEGAPVLPEDPVARKVWIKCYYYMSEYRFICALLCP